MKSEFPAGKRCFADFEKVFGGWVIMQEQNVCLFKLGFEKVFPLTLPKNM